MYEKSMQVRIAHAGIVCSPRIRRYRERLQDAGFSISHVGFSGATHPMFTIIRLLLHFSARSRDVVDKTSELMSLYASDEAKVVSTEDDQK